MATLETTVQKDDLGDQTGAGNAAAVAVDFKPNADITPPVNNDAEKQAELVLLQAQMTGTQVNFDQIAVSCAQALQTLKGEGKARKINAVLHLIDESQASMKEISRGIMKLLNVEQMEANNLLKIMIIQLRWRTFVKKFFHIR